MPIVTSADDMMRGEWRELGFFYDLNHDDRYWQIVGDRAGLSRFASLVEDFASNPANDVISHQKNFGPHSYLEIGVWNTPEITEHWIAGPLPDLLALARTTKLKVESMSIGHQIFLKELFAAQSTYDLVLECREDGFDVASCDKSLSTVALGA